MRDVGAEHQLDLPVLGVPIHFETNSLTVADCIRDTFGDWRALEERPDLIGAIGGTVRFVVQDEPEPVQPAPYQFRVLADGRVLRFAAGSFGVSDPLRRESITFVTPSQVADYAQFRHAVVESTTIGLLTVLDRQPMHAAAVMSNGVAILLAGRSGTGKSTLVYALARAGFEVLTDDSVYLQLDPTLRAWGLPRFLHLSEESRVFFPDLARCSSILLANGKRKIAIDARSRGFVSGLPVSDRVVLCLLDRDSGPARLEPITDTDLEAGLTRNPESGFDIFADSIRPAIHALSEAGGWRLHLGANPNDAVPLVQRIVADASTRL